MTYTWTHACVLGCLTALTACVALAGNDRVFWTVQLDDYTPTQFVTVAPDGTIYVTGGDAIYALNPQGDILWVSPAAPSDGVAHSISLGSDGSIYTGMGIVGDAYSLVVALNPDGTIQWQYVPPVFGSLVTGPNVGPDGNIYAVQEPAPFNGLGAFSLDPDGNLRWANATSLPPLPADTFISTSDIEFGADRLHTGYIPTTFTNPTLHTFSLAGDFLWSNVGVSPHTTSLPVVDPQHRVLCTWGQTGMRVFSQDGKQEWFAFHPNGASLVERPTVDSNGVIYTGDFVGVELWAINPDGTTRWVQPPQDAYMSNVAVSPDDQTLIVSGQVFSGQNWIRGYATDDGALLWQVDLPPVNDLHQFASSYEPGFAPDSSVTYVTTQFAGAANDYGFIYAISLTGDKPPPPKDCSDMLFPAVNPEYAVGDSPFSVAIGDLDSDGNLDLAVANLGNSVSILLNNGDGMFASDVLYSAGFGPVSIALGDLDGDGNLDLAVANQNSNNVSILLNRGDGTFAADVLYGAGSSPKSIAIGDLDGEGDLDLAVANQNGPNVSILLNNGDGTFANDVLYGAGGGSRFVALGDVDSDGDLDLAVTNFFSDNLSILLNNGNGTFADDVLYGTGAGPQSVAIGDLDGDSDLDLAVANQGSANVSVLLNQGDGAFAADVLYGAGALPQSLALGDLDADGGLDLAVANFGSDNVSILLNQSELPGGDGIFDSDVLYNSGVGPASVAIGDLDGDGDLDLAVTNSLSDSVSVLLNNCTILGDINLDGLVDLLDVAPFVALLISEEFQAEADINQDGVVSLLDVQPFVDMISGG